VHRERRRLREISEILSDEWAVREVLRRPLHAQQLRVLGFVGRGVGGVDPLLVDRRPQHRQAVAVDRPEPAPQPGVVDEHEAPVLRVAAARRPDRGIEDALLHVVGDRVGAAPAHGAGRVQGLVDVHGRSLARDRPGCPPTELERVTGTLVMLSA
jgi:hypothetical protein